MFARNKPRQLAWQPSSKRERIWETEQTKLSICSWELCCQSPILPDRLFISSCNFRAWGFAVSFLMVQFNTGPFFSLFTRQRLLEEEEQEEEESVDHVFPLLTSPLWHVHTWFSLECRLCGVSCRQTSSWFHLGSGGLNAPSKDTFPHHVCSPKSVMLRRSDVRN